jgi:hypothetical protein
VAETKQSQSSTHDEVLEAHSIVGMQILLLATSLESPTFVIACGDHLVQNIHLMLRSYFRGLEVEAEGLIVTESKRIPWDERVLIRLVAAEPN